MEYDPKEPRTTATDDNEKIERQQPSSSWNSVSYSDQIEPQQSLSQTENEIISKHEKTCEISSKLWNSVSYSDQIEPQLIQMKFELISKHGKTCELSPKVWNPVSYSDQLPPQFQ